MSEKISMQMVKELRDTTGVGMTKCKEALVMADGDMQTAIDILRKQGMTSALKKEGRETKEGFIGVAEDAHGIALVELNAETDFVAKNEKFQEFLSALAAQALRDKPSSVDAFVKAPFIKDAAVTVDQKRNLVIQNFGENIQIGLVENITKKPNATYGIYLHMGGKIVTIVEIIGSSDVKELAKDVAMHIAAESPDYLVPEEVPHELKSKEEEIARAQIQGKKPENIIEKIVEGKLKAFYDQVCLLSQKFVKDSNVTVRETVDNWGKKIQKPLQITRFWRRKIG
ncbi:MAG: elongation factor Ts [Parachlamydiales bacterium]|nr:elongation factor Ts [Parachlamydiales bacterium]